MERSWPISTPFMRGTSGSGHRLHHRCWHCWSRLESPQEEPRRRTTTKTTLTMSRICTRSLRLLEYAWTGHPSQIRRCSAQEFRLARPESGLFGMLQEQRIDGYFDTYPYEEAPGAPL